MKKNSISVKRAGFDLKNGTIVKVTIIINSGQQEREFLGYIKNTHHETVDGYVDFVMVVSQAYINVMKPNAKVHIKACCKSVLTQNLIDVPETINVVRHSSMIEGIIEPTMFGSMVSRGFT